MKKLTKLVERWHPPSYPPPTATVARRMLYRLSLVQRPLDTLWHLTHGTPRQLGDLLHVPARTLTHGASVEHYFGEPPMGAYVHAPVPANRLCELLPDLCVEKDVIAFMRAFNEVGVDAWWLGAYTQRFRVRVMVRIVNPDDFRSVYV